MPATTGFQYAAVLEAARLGLYWRWRGNELAHRILDELALRDDGAHAIGAHCTDESKDTADALFVGEGWERSGIYAMGSICEAMILHGIGQVHERATAYSPAASALLCKEDTWRESERFEVGMAARVAVAARRAIAQSRQDLEGTHRRAVLRKGGDVRVFDDYTWTGVEVNHAYPKVRGYEQRGEVVTVHGAARQLDAAHCATARHYCLASACDGSAKDGEVAYATVLTQASLRADEPHADPCAGGRPRQQAAGPSNHVRGRETATLDWHSTGHEQHGGANGHRGLAF